MSCRNISLEINFLGNGTFHLGLVPQECQSSREKNFTRWISFSIVSRFPRVLFSQGNKNLLQFLGKTVGHSLISRRNVPYEFVPTKYHRGSGSLRFWAIFLGIQTRKLVVSSSGRSSSASTTAGPPPSSLQHIVGGQREWGSIVFNKFFLVD